MAPVNSRGNYLGIVPRRPGMPGHLGYAGYNDALAVDIEHPERLLGE